MAIGCREQNSRYVPGSVKRWLKVSPFRLQRLAKPTGPLATVTSWYALPWKCQRTVASRGIDRFRTR